MRKITFLILNSIYLSLTPYLFQIISPVDVSAQTSNYTLSFSTYLGSSDVEHARDIAIDAQGNMIVVGGTKSSTFPTTLADLTTSTCPLTGAEGNWDAFVTKFNSTGTLLWSLKMGGMCYDRIYAVELDSVGNIYISGRAGEGFPVTAGSFQTSFLGTNQGIYGNQNAFVAKLGPNGNKIWASYAGTGNLARDIAVDSDGDVYIPLAYSGAGAYANSLWLTNAYQATPRGGRECGVMKIRSDGSQVIWATYFGGTGNDSQEASVSVDSAENVYLTGFTDSTNLPTTSLAYDRIYNGGPTDLYVAKFSADGSQLMYSTYLGGSGEEYMNTHNLSLDANGDAYISVYTTSSNYPITVGAFQTTAGGGVDIGLSKISSTGGLSASSYLASGGDDNSDGITVGIDNNVYISGVTNSANFPVTSNAYQTVKSTGNDAFSTIINANLTALVYSTFIGGQSYDNVRGSTVDSGGNFYLVGSTDGAGWPTVNPYQSTFQGGSGTYGTGDAVVAKFTPLLPTSTPTTSIPAPSPTNTPAPTSTPTPLPPVPGDANGDRYVDGLDYVIWLNHYNSPTSNSASDGDFNSSGNVDGLDYVVWLNNYGAQL